MKVQYHNQHKVHIKTTFLIRRLLIAWLAGAAVELLLLPAELKTMVGLKGLAAMSLPRLLIMAGVIFAGLSVLSRLLPHGAERWMLVGSFAVPAVAALTVSFTWPFLGACLLVFTALLVHPRHPAHCREGLPMATYLLCAGDVAEPGYRC